MARLRAFVLRQRRRLPFFVLAVAAAAHLHFALEGQMTHLRWDSAEYLAAAQHLATGRGFLNATGAVEARRTPGYPLFLAPLLAAGAGVKTIVAVQHLLAIALAVAVYFVALAIAGDELAALIAGLFVAIDSGQLYMADVVMTETLMSALLVVAVALLVRLSRRPSIALAAAGGLIVGMSVLVRPAAMYLFIPLVIWTAVALPPHWRARAAAVFALAALILPALWSWRNLEKAGTFALSSIVGEDLYYWRAAGAVAMEKSGFQFAPLPLEGEDAFRRQFFRVTQHEFVAAANAAHRRAFGARAATMSDAQLSAFDGALARQILREHPRGLILVSVNGALHLLFDSTDEYANALYGSITRDFVAVLLLVSAVASVGLAMAGLVRLHRRDRAAAWLLAVVLAYFVAVLSGPEHEQWRYRVPLIPLAAMLVGCSALPGPGESHGRAAQ